MSWSGKRADLWTAAIVFCVCAAVYSVSPNVTSFDSRWTVHAALSLLHRGDIDLDEYLPLLARDKFYGIECVTAARVRTFPVVRSGQCPAGHYYNFYPMAVPMLAAPAVFTLERGLSAAQPLIRPLAPHLPAKLQRDMPRRFLEGDMLGGAPVTEVVVASWIAALAAALMYLLAREFLGAGPSLVMAGLFAFATPVWSTASRALWQHGPSMLLLTLTLWLAVRARQDPRWIGFAGPVAALAFYVRPSNAVWLAAITLFVFVHHRRRFWVYLLGMLPVVALFSAINLSIYGHLLAPYSFPQRAASSSLTLFPLPEALAGHLISPARGLFIFVPLFLLSVYGACLKPEWPAARSLRPYLAGALAAHYLLISSFTDWSAGHSYGPRYFTDVVPLLIFFLFPVAQRIAERTRRAALLAGLFCALSAASLFIHFEGATNWECMRWNVAPIEIGKAPWRIWDWRDLQFLRGLKPPVPAAASGSSGAGVSDEVRQLGGADPVEALDGAADLLGEALGVVFGGVVDLDFQEEVCTGHMG